jgi:hypothetical protein
MNFCVDNEINVKTAQKPIAFIFTTAIAVVLYEENIVTNHFGALFWGPVPA